MSTIDLGIDLGTTNSAIAICRGHQCALVPGADGDPLLPSAVHVTATGDVVVGKAARAAIQTDPANVAIEFKRQMGNDAPRAFPSSGRRLSPEELSAAVLGALCVRAAEAHGAAPRAVVITIPAMFHLPQCDATRRAATLAGIEHAPLLQEPIAAAIAHSGSGEVRNGTWLIYDLGGGTFDVSLVRCKDGRLQVLDHDGDNHLGGRDLDRVLVRTAIDRIREDGRFGDLAYTDPANAELITRIKVECERVRLALSAEERARFHIRQAADAFELEVDRDALEAMLLPTIQRTTALCRRLLDRNRVTARALSGLVLVGGPTLTPSLPRVVGAEIGIPATHSGDPMTIVARGAALFASTQRLPPGLRRRGGGGIELQLEYEPMTTDPRPLLAGRVLAPSPPPPGLTISLAGDHGRQTAPVAADGAFAFDLELAPSRLNMFQLGAVDRTGAAIATDPSSLKILHGFSIARPPLSQSIGIVLADNTVAWYLRKGVPLPARHVMTHTTTLPLRRGQSGEAVHVPLVQGESAVADRNKLIGVIQIHAAKIARDLPAGTTVEVTITVDESSQTIGRAYVPVLDQWFDDIVRFELEAKSAEAVAASAAELKQQHAKRLAELADQLDAEGGSRDVQTDARFAEVDKLLGDGERDGIDVADQLVRAMTEDLDAAGARGRKVALQGKLDQLQPHVAELVGARGDPSESRQASALCSEIKHALDRSDLDGAAAKLEELDSLKMKILLRQPEFWRGLFTNLIERAREQGFEAAAAPHVAKGQAAVAGGHPHELPPVCLAILGLFPAAEQARIAPQIRSDIN